MNLNLQILQGAEDGKWYLMIDGEIWKHPFDTKEEIYQEILRRCKLAGISKETIADLENCIVRPNSELH